MATAADIVTSLCYATSGSCTCLTKTPVVSFHKPTCTYRIVSEAIEFINSQEKRLQLAAELVKMIDDESSHDKLLRSALERKRQEEGEQLEALKEYLQMKKDGDGEYHRDWVADCQKFDELTFNALEGSLKAIQRLELFRNRFNDYQWETLQEALLPVRDPLIALAEFTGYDEL